MPRRTKFSEVPGAIHVEVDGNKRLSQEKRRFLWVLAHLAQVVFKKPVYAVYLNTVHDNPDELYGIKIVFRKEETL